MRTSKVSLLNSCVSEVRKYGPLSVDALNSNSQNTQVPSWGLAVMYVALLVSKWAPLSVSAERGGLPTEPLPVKPLFSFDVFHTDDLTTFTRTAGLAHDPQSWRCGRLLLDRTRGPSYIARHY